MKETCEIIIVNEGRIEGTFEMTVVDGNAIAVNANTDGHVINAWGVPTSFTVTYYRQDDGSWLPYADANPAWADRSTREAIAAYSSRYREGKGFSQLTTNQCRKVLDILTPKVNAWAQSRTSDLDRAQMMKNQRAYLDALDELEKAAKAAADAETKVNELTELRGVAEGLLNGDMPSRFTWFNLDETSKRVIRNKTYRD